METGQQPQAPEQTEDYDMQTIIQDWETSKTNRESYTSDFPSLDSIVDGIPITHQKGAPYVGDTTLAGLVRQIPRDSMKQLPVFSAVINGTKNSISAHINSYFLRSVVFNQDTFGKGLLSTLQLGGEQALTHGYAPFMVATGLMFDDFGTMMRLLHYADVDPEPGIQDHNETGYDYVVANLTKTRVKKIRNNAKNNPNSTWFVEALDRLLEIGPDSSQNYSIYKTAARQQGGQTNNSTYTFVTQYEVGKGGKFITFCPQIEDMPLRVVKNRSKFGFPRVNFLVIDPAPLSPFGTSRVRLASPNQNLMNAYYQNVASMFILNSAPPILKRGRFTKPVQLKQNAVWETLDQNATAELVELSNGSLTQFVQIAQQMSAQIQNMMGVPTGTINGGSNAMGYSKTAPGVKMQQQASDSSTNQVTNIMENFLRQHALVSLDTFIAEQTVDVDDPENPNEEEIIVDDECKNAINRLAKQNFQPSPEVPEFIPLIGDDNIFTINWNAFYDDIKKMSVEIELSIGKDELDEKQRADLQDMLTTLLQNSDAIGPEIRQYIIQLLDMLMEKSVPQSKRFNPMPEVPVPTTVPPETAEAGIINQ